ncbi:MAG: neuraminidase-like domain-containing protein [Cyanobacteria bacterium P01_H01_bin.21]
MEAALRLWHFVAATLAAPQIDFAAEISLMLDGEIKNLATNSNVKQTDEPIELEAGQLYELRIAANNVETLPILKWETESMGKVAIPKAQIYPALSLENFQATYLRLLKILTIVDILELSNEELAHFATHNDYRIGDAEWLNALPVNTLSDEAIVQELFRNVSTLLQYRNLKESLQVSDDSLLQLLQEPSRVDDGQMPVLSQVTGLLESEVTALSNHLRLAIDDLIHLENFSRLYNAVSIVKTLGIGASVLVTNTTNDPTADNLRALQSALRVRYDRDAWLKVMQPINDELRSLQRDALVAYVLHRLEQNEITRHIDTPDRLFEYFLIDVQMDPCMKTSRIKQAIASVQLFVQRCLMNLEPKVAASTINAKQWEWMKRYRVWEANRKVFLYPENWLEPELRDNKSSFFKDFESELLQSDITDDAAATALVHYLEKLDEVAKLEICGMYYEENELNNKADDVVHVIARTAGARRTYYYRRQEGISWTPWEKIDLNIEDTPVLPVVWQGRLFLFWLSVLQSAAENTVSEDSNQTILWNASISKLRNEMGEAQTKISVVLYWSEYYHSKWQPPRTSDINQPLPLARASSNDLKKSLINAEFNTSENGKFNRDKLNLDVIEVGKELIISVNYNFIRNGFFILNNTHSLPETRSFVGSYEASIIQSWGYSKGNWDQEFMHKIPIQSHSYQLIWTGYWIRKEDFFFFQDNKGVFFVKLKDDVPLSIEEREKNIFIYKLFPMEFNLEDELITRSDFPHLDDLENRLFRSKLNKENNGFIDMINDHDDHHIEQFLKQRESIRFGDQLIGKSDSINYLKFEGR